MKSLRLFLLVLAVPMSLAAQAVKRITVTLGAYKIPVGASTKAGAIVQLANNKYTTTRVVGWSTSSQSVATIDDAGTVTPVGPGIAMIIATVGHASGQAAISVTAATTPVDTAKTPPVDTVKTPPVDTVKTPPVDTTKAPPVDTVKTPPVDTVKAPPPSPGHPHEPPGFVQLVQPLSGDTMPLTIYGGGAAYEIGWLQNATGATVVVDSSVPYASKKVLQSSFPAGMGGGGAPSDVWTASPANPSNWPFATPPRRAMAMYESFYYKLSPEFPINLIANKVMYNHTWYDALGGNQHAPVITMAQATSDYGTQFTAPIWPAACLQGVTGVDGKLFAGCLYEWSDADPLKWTQVKRGVWHHWETLYELNTKGQYDGSAQIWLDGKLIINFVHRIKFTDEQEWWANAYWAPVYGGAGSIPANAAPISYHRLKDLYVSGSKDGARVSFAAPLARTARPQIMTIRGLSAKTDTTGAPKIKKP